jgi:hypothetical protein
MLLTAWFASLLVSVSFAGEVCVPPIAKVSIKHDKYKYISLVGKGYFPSDARDMFGDTAGGWGSGIAADVKSWKKRSDGVYEGTLYTLPDRGWNANGTTSDLLASLGASLLWLLWLLHWDRR